MEQMKPSRKNRNAAYFRHHRKRVIARKAKIVQHNQWYVKNQQYGRLDKNKIHCSCKMCQVKTNVYGWPKSQQAVWIDMEQQLQEYGVRVTSNRGKQKASL